MHEPASGASCFSPRLFYFFLIVAAAAWFTVTQAQAQTCWVYTESENAKTPIRCVQKSDLTTSCSWPTDCTTVPAASSQTIREMHAAWHTCFGATGVSGVSSPPPGRSQRWYAFHRQFAFDFNAWRRPLGFAPIESLEWCPNMIEPLGTAPSGSPASPGCGSGTPRPAGLHCPECIAFPHCLFKAGGGPVACPSAPSSSCTAPGSSISFPYTSLEQFHNVDEVANIMDAYFHGNMHTATADADCPSCYNHDSYTSSCSPRDPMFWRLHQALDDVVRAWQDEKAVDVVLVIDRSGSMSGPDSGGGTKLQAALNAVDNFADLMDTNRTDGQVNRLGVVSYSDTASIDMGMTNVDIHLRDAGGPLANAISHINSVGATGCTAIAQGLQKALDILCPTASGGNCSGFSSATGNPRKAILVMTDGVENISPCLQPAGASGGSCGTQCFGPQFDFNKLEFTQLVSVGFGSGTDLNGRLLTLLAERQGGIYMQNPNTPGNDLKDFFAKAFGQLSPEFLLVDPKGTLPASQAAADPVEYNGCADSMLTFTSGWNVGVTPGELTLVVDNPAGDLVLRGDPKVEYSQQRLWHYSRVRLPYRGAVSGTWHAQIVRRHHLYLNGFTPDAFADLKEGTALVRREIHRLCPQGCKRVLHYEGSRRFSQSAYAQALKLEKQSGAVNVVTDATDPTQFAKMLAPGKWDLIVFAEMGKDTRLPYDALLARLICAGQRIIITDTRQKSRTANLECANVRAGAPVNWAAIQRNGNLVDRDLKLVNRGYPVFSYAVIGSSVQATASISAPAPVGAVAARTDAGKDENWFVDILGNSLGKLSPHNRQVSWKTGTTPIAEVRMLPSNVRQGGWDKVDARVEVEYPIVGLGTLLATARPQDSRRINGELIDARTLALEGIKIPTSKATFKLYDDGTHDDIYPGNAYWTGELAGLGKTDGMYKLRYMFDLTAGGCTTHRELVQSVFVDAGVTPKASAVVVGTPATLPNGWRKFNVTVTPADVFQNKLGPWRATAVNCAPQKSCRAETKMVDEGKGTYRLALEVAPQTASVQVDAFDTTFDLPTSCPNCPRIAGVSLAPAAVLNNQPAHLTVTLSAPAPETPEGGAVVFLSSNLRRVASVPESVVVPAGKSSVVVPVKVYHVHEEPEEVTLVATYGGASQSKGLKVSPNESKASAPVSTTPHHHDDD